MERNSPVYIFVEEDEAHDEAIESDSAIRGTESCNHPALPSPPSPAQEQVIRSLIDPCQRTYAISLFSICTILLFADQNLMSPNLTAIGKEFGFTDDERDTKLGGQIALAFFVLGAPASFVIGALGDVYNRMRLFALTVGIGEGACLATYWTKTYSYLYACRAITGFSIGGALPLIYSILGDMYSAEERHIVSALVGVGTGAGIALGQGVAGFLGPTFGWRLPFLLVSIPALICAAVVLITVPEPKRGEMEQVVLEHRFKRGRDDVGCCYEMAPIEDSDGVNSPAENRVEESPPATHSTWANFKSLMATPTVVLSLLQGAPGCVPWGIVNTYLNDYLAENRGMTVELATFTVLIFGLGNFVGMLLGGAGGSRLYRMDKRYPPLYGGLMAMLGCLPFWIMLNFVTHATPFLVTGSVSFLAGMTSGITGPIIKATVQNVTLPQQRGQAFALYNTFDDFGRGLGPVFVAVLITKMGRTTAFNIGTLGWFICGIMNALVFFTVQKDEATVQTLIAASLTDEDESTSRLVRSNNERAD